MLNLSQDTLFYMICIKSLVRQRFVAEDLTPLVLERRRKDEKTC